MAKTKEAIFDFIKKRLFDFSIGTSVINLESLRSYKVIDIKYCSDVEIYFDCISLGFDHDRRMFNALSGSIMSIDEASKLLEHMCETVRWIEESGYDDIKNLFDIEWRVFKLKKNLELAKEGVENDV